MSKGLRLGISLVVGAIVGLILNFTLLPSLSIHSATLWWVVFLSMVAATATSWAIATIMDEADEAGDAVFLTLITVIFAIVGLIGNATGSKCFQASDY